MAEIQGLIDKFDVSEIVRDQIAGILKLESEEQQRLAVSAGKDPALWKLRVFTEASNPWSEWVSAPDDNSPLADTSPLVNVKFDSETFDKSKGNIFQRQQAAGVFNIDVYGYGKSSASGEGHIPGDRAAALEAQRAMRLVRNILMSSSYVMLGMGAPDIANGPVAGRWPQSIQIFSPPLDERTVQHIVGARLALAVDFDEFAPQYEPVLLELIAFRFIRSSSGELDWFSASYPH